MDNKNSGVQNTHSVVDASSEQINIKLEKVYGQIKEILDEVGYFDKKVDMRQAEESKPELVALKEQHIQLIKEYHHIKGTIKGEREKYGEKEVEKELLQVQDLKSSCLEDYGVFTGMVIFNNVMDGIIEGIKNELYELNLEEQKERFNFINFIVEKLKEEKEQVMQELTSRESDIETQLPIDPELNSLFLKSSYIPSTPKKVSTRSGFTEVKENAAKQPATKVGAKVNAVKQPATKVGAEIIVAKQSKPPKPTKEQLDNAAKVAIDFAKKRHILIEEKKDKDDIARARYDVRSNTYLNREKEKKENKRNQGLVKGNE